MNNEKIGMIIGIFLLVSGIVILLWVLTSAMAIVQSPGAYFEEQFPQEEENTQGPNAQFSWDTNDLSVDFRDKSKEGDAPISSWEWDFGDGETSNDQNPQHTFQSNGDYEVSLTVEDENGESSTTYSDVNVALGNNGGGRSEPEDGDISFDFDSNFIVPLAAAFLLGMLHLVMFLIGAALVKGGWNLIKQGPSTLKLKIKPKRLEVEQAEQEPTYSPQPAPSQVPATSVQQTPAYSPQPTPGAVIASLQSLPANSPQPAQTTQPAYAQPNQMNCYLGASAPQQGYPQPAPVTAPPHTRVAESPYSQTDILNFNESAFAPQQDLPSNTPAQTQPIPEVEKKTEQLHPSKPVIPKEELKETKSPINAGSQGGARHGCAAVQPIARPQKTPTVRQSYPPQQNRVGPGASKQAPRGHPARSPGTKGRGPQTARRPPAKGRGRPKGRGKSKGKGRRKKR